MLTINGTEVLAGMTRKEIAKTDDNMDLLVEAQESRSLAPMHTMHKLNGGFTVHARATFRRRGSAGVSEEV